MSTAQAHILCAVQSDDLAPSVVANARRLANAGGYELHSLHVADVPARTAPIYPGVVGTPAFSRDLMVDEFTAAGQELFERLGLDPESAEVVSGDPARELAAKADEIEPEFILLGSRGHGPLAGAILGSVTRSLADDRRWPLLIVSDSDNPPPRDAVVCGITTPLEDAVLVARSAARLARRLAKPLVLAHVSVDEGSGASFDAGGFPAAPGAVLPTVVLGVVSAPEADKLLDAVASRLDAGIEIRKETLSGAPAQALATLAGEERAEAIVVGRRGLGALRSAIQGSVSLDLIRDADCPIMVVPGTSRV